MYNELINLLEVWGKDIHNISFKYYDGVVEMLVNDHYICYNKIS